MRFVAHHERHALSDRQPVRTDVAVGRRSHAHVAGVGQRAEHLSRRVSAAHERPEGEPRCAAQRFRAPQVRRTVRGDDRAEPGSDGASYDGAGIARVANCFEHHHPFRHRRLIERCVGEPCDGEHALGIHGIGERVEHVCRHRMDRSDPHPVAGAQALGVGMTIAGTLGRVAVDELRAGEHSFERCPAGQRSVDRPRPFHDSQARGISLAPVAHQA